MRIALIPLDSRPANWQFPQRLADIAGLELAIPSRGLLGSLRSPADAPRLLAWLEHEGPGCDAIVLSLDALLYGGLVQSRAPGRLMDTEELLLALGWLKRSPKPVYAYLTIPRLGMTIDTPQAHSAHGLIRAWLIACAEASAPGAGAAAIRRASELNEQLDQNLAEQVLSLRERNLRQAMEVLALADALDFKLLHFPVEDNAPAGPHLREAAELKAAGTVMNTGRRGAGRMPVALSFFDGADECACLLLARASADLQGAAPLPVHLMVHPASPGPERYTGLYESHTLDEGLDFCARFLRLEYRQHLAQADWLVCYGTQPQPDAFEADAGRLFNNPFLLPPDLPGDAEPSLRPLFVSDLAACNGANPHLAIKAGVQGGRRLAALLGWNTNFNTLGSSAALLSLAGRSEKPNIAALQRFLLERLADDVVYQSLARPEVLAWLRERKLSPFDFGQLSELQLRELRLILVRHWREWCTGAGAGLLSRLGLPQQAAALLHFDFPWHRAFEVQVEAPEL